MHGGVQAAFQYGILAPFCRPRREPPPEQLEQPQQRPLGIMYHDNVAGGDAPQQAPRHRADDNRLHRNQVHQRRPDRPRERSAKVETLRAAHRAHSEDETDAERREEEQNVSAESDSENQQDMQEEPAGAAACSVDANKTKSQPKPCASDSDASMDYILSFSRDGGRTDGATGDPQVAERLPAKGQSAEKEPAERQPSQTDVQASSLFTNPPRKFISQI